MANKVAWVALIAILLWIGWLFFQVVRPFFTSLFVAAILAVLFRPQYERVRAYCGNRSRVAAAITTCGIVLLILLPIGGGLVLAGKQLVDVGTQIAHWAESPTDPEVEGFFTRVGTTTPGRWLEKTLREQNIESWNDAMLGTATTLAREVSEKTLGLVADLFGFLVGAAVMLLATYYFFADGELLLAYLQRISPLHHEDDLVLWQQFESMSRSVVLGTIVAGLAQAVLAAIGFALLGVENVWLLAALTWLTSLIPFVGAASVWLVVCIGLVLDDRYIAAAILTVYGATVVSGSDNLIRAYVIGNGSHLHPLVVLVSVLGALQFIGLWGIFAGPMIAAIFYSLLSILHKRLPASPSDGRPVYSTAKRLRLNI
jgi:predicted PurR-regulated permease PerM